MRVSKRGSGRRRSGGDLPSLSGIEKVRRLYGLGPNDALSTAQFREAYSLSGASGDKRKARRFSFRFEIDEVSPDLVRVIVYGNHISKNAFDSLLMSQRLSYKSAFKKGVKEFWLRERGRLRDFQTMKRASISFVFHTHHSRDYDNYLESVKRVQDSLVRLGFVEDDKQSCLLPDGEWISERKCPKSETPKIVVTLKRVEAE